MNGAPLPAQHGFPLRLVVPGWYGMQNVKWLGADHAASRGRSSGTRTRSPTATTSSEDEPGEPVTRMVPRSLMVPPGIPDFMTRERRLDPGAVELRGRAWSGWGPIERVEVLDRRRRHALPRPNWSRLSAPPPGAAGASCGSAGEGQHVLCSRATDAAGNTQPLDPPWNLKGYANNAVERVAVTVEAGT